MKIKKLTISTCLMLLSLAAFSQSKLKGDWMGTLQAGGGVRILFHIKDSAGVQSATMDSPDQGANGIPFTSTLITGDSIVLQLQMVQAMYKGVLQNDTTLSGAWSQGTISLPLTLHRTKAGGTAAVIRPQTPKPPFPYNSDSMEYNNADKSVHFGATLTYPKTGSGFPAAILITGSGQEDRDETIFGHKPFAVIADYLTREGYAVLRVDDRGMGKTTGAVKTATSKDFAADVEAGIAYLGGRKEIDKNKIGLVGHSEGGLIASIVAAENKNIAFVIMLAGPGEKGSELMPRQMQAMMQANGMSTKAAASYKDIYAKVLNNIITLNDSAAAFKQSWKDYKTWAAGLDSATRKELNIQSDDISQQQIASLVHQMSGPWVKYFLQANPADYIKQFHCKVLALNGGKDIQVVPKPNLQGIEAALKESKSPAYETHELPGLNHLFQHCKTCTATEYGQIDETFAPEALQMMAAWLHKNVS